jgi:hypothetical protein
MALTAYLESLPMRFQITLNMPSRSQNLVHQILADAPFESLADFVDWCNDMQFIIVDEIYKDGLQTNCVGQLAINTDVIGKIKIFRP